MYYAHYDNQTGEILGFYTSDIHDNIPTPNIEITYDQWQECLNNQGRRKIDVITKQIVACEPPAPTKDQLLAQLDAEYTPQFQQLQQAWAAAQLDGNTALVNELQTEYQVLKQEYQTKREAIING
jgi:cellulose synthase/poly-beta-1,6-N-acetylglucosamine synthase-like glycosyltransferase